MGMTAEEERELRAEEIVRAIDDLIEAKIHMIDDQSAEGYSDWREKDELKAAVLRVLR